MHSSEEVPGLPRFDAKHTISWIQWAWFLGIVAAAILAGLCIYFSQRFRRNWAKCCKIIASILCFSRYLHRCRGRIFCHLLRFPENMRWRTDEQLGGVFCEDPDPDCTGKDAAGESLYFARVARRKYFSSDLFRSSCRIRLCSYNRDRSEFCSSSYDGRTIWLCQQKTGDDRGGAFDVLPAGVYFPVLPGAAVIASKKCRYLLKCMRKKKIADNQFTFSCAESGVFKGKSRK